MAGRYSVPATFYMLQGAWVAVLSGLLLAVVAAQKKTLWRDLALGALAISILEGVEIPACRLFVVDISKIHGNICDAVTGLPISAVTICIEVFFLAWLVGSYLRE